MMRLYDKFFEEVAEKIEKVILHMEAEYHENDDDAKDVNNKELNSKDMEVS